MASTPNDVRKQTREIPGTGIEIRDRITRFDP
jgi:hypothetical protein